ncbi:hypothetical protein H6F46_06815 [Limnothrix sp. FACHB-1083]|uniref:hypothetical protein n=1 Tax=unclassified Limnothrix TaxID=2632864 RepID=UPI0016808B35|nr:MULTISPECIES: hypothetical protein [unclassified Limnothrix]MBD2160404.1 hypothetical protein [Limnothrix sp. FACHB-1083]MBD2191105.1 hypothetical protein [Limnothrix sp. FACHB-1088]
MQDLTGKRIKVQTSSDCYFAVVESVDSDSWTVALEDHPVFKVIPSDGIELGVVQVVDGMNGENFPVVAGSRWLFRGLEITVDSVIGDLVVCQSRLGQITLAASYFARLTLVG